MPLDLHIVAGRPDPTEIAVLAAVLSARTAAAGTAVPPGTIRSEWSSRRRLVREPLLRGPGGWRSSALPR